jgi:hypothetical protein
MTTVNNYAFGRYDDGEVWIQTEPRQLVANNGKVYLTIKELRELLACADGQCGGWRHPQNEAKGEEINHIGFTGTRSKITNEQQMALRQILRDWCLGEPSVTEKPMYQSFESYQRSLLELKRRVDKGIPLKFYDIANKPPYGSPQ